MACFRVIMLLLVLVVCETTHAALRRLNCPPIKLANGRVRLRHRNGFIQFQCNKSYMLAGDKYMKCLPSARWENEPPHCVRGTCQPIKTPQNSFAFPSYKNGVMNFFCRPDHQLHGPQVVYCDGKRWSGYLPTCINRTLETSLNCDFEREDACGWTHDVNHDFDWVRWRGATPSGVVGTGPKWDHTIGEVDDPKTAGYYMYIEATSRNLNDTARLISPTYPSQFNTNTCFEFFYHMYGVSTGALRVYLKKFGDETWTFDPDEAIFTRAGNQGNRWRRGFIQLGSIDDDFQIVIEGIRGNGYLSDIAIDDVRIIENCTEVSTTDDVTESSSTASTDSGTIGGYPSCANQCGMPPATGDLCGCSFECLDRDNCCPDFIPLCGMVDYFTQASEDSSSSTSTEYYPSTLISENDDAISIATSEQDVVAAFTSKATSTTTTTIQPTSASTRPPPPPRRTLTTRRRTPTTTTTISSTAIMNTTPMNKKTMMMTNTTTKSRWRRPTTTTLMMMMMNTTTLMLDVSGTTTKLTGDVDDHATRPTAFVNNNNKVATTTLRASDVATVPPASRFITFDAPFDDNRPVSVVSLIDASHDDVVNANKSFTGVGVGGVLATLLAFVVLIAVMTCWWRRQRRLAASSCCCNRLTYRSHSYGDSQSDVRFLTGDEVLDFTLATP